MDNKVNDRQEKFLHEYLLDFNATQAAIRAGYSAKTAAAAASRLLRNVNVQKRLKELQDEIYSASKLDKQDIIKELANIAFYDVNDYLEVKGSVMMSLRDIEQLPSNKRKAIKTIRNGKYGVQIEFDSRTKALEMLMEYFGMKNGEDISDDEENTGIVMMPERMERPDDIDNVDEDNEQ